MGRASSRHGRTTDPLWYKDAIIYELHVRAFFDSDGDGIGDFAGLIDKLDYLQDLGVTALWLLPFYPSPLRDDGYDIADYARDPPDVRDARATSARSCARRTAAGCASSPSWCSTTPPTSTRGSSARGGAPPAAAGATSTSGATRRTGTGTRASSSRTSSRPTGRWDPVAGAYYWHRFYAHQPDLNFDNPDVQRGDAARRLDFWLDLGVDGLRLDAVPYLYEREGTNCENLPETHAFLKELRAPHRREVPRPHAAGRGQPVARGRGRLLRRRATSATWPSTSRSCRGCSWRSTWRTASRSSTSSRRRRRSRRRASGRCSCATTTSSRSRW